MGTMRSLLVLVLAAGNAAAQHNCDASRLQTLDASLPVAPSVVARELLDACPNPPLFMQLALDPLSPAMDSDVPLTASARALKRALRAARLGPGSFDLHPSPDSIGDCERWLAGDGVPAARADRIARALFLANPPRRPKLRPILDDGIPLDPICG